MPIISIILPTHKSPLYLSKSLDSVLSQSFADWELIIIDDGLDVVALEALSVYLKKDLRIKVYSNPKNLGIQKSLNCGLELAQGKYIARIDDDDQWIDGDKLKRQVDFLEVNPDYVLVGTDGVICDNGFVDLQKYSMPKSDLEIRNRLLFKNCFLHSSVLIRRCALDKVGKYLDEKCVGHVEDYDLWLRLGLVGKIINLNHNSVRIMVNENSVTFKNRIKQAQRDLMLSFCYRNNYPYFYFALLLGILRLMFFYLNFILPVPQKILYKIQAMYKAI